MAKIPDWLANSMAKDSALIDDSPQFRALEQARQKGNLMKAADTAMEEVDKRIKQDEFDTLKARLETRAMATPFPVPLSGPNNELLGDSGPAPVIPGPDEFSSEPILAEETANQPSLLDEIQATPPTEDIADPNVLASVQKIASVTGLSPDKVALMTLLGKEIAKTQQTQSPTPLPTNLPTPLGGPSPLSTTPPIV